MPWAAAPAAATSATRQTVTRTRPKRGRAPFSQIATVGIIYNALPLCPTKKQFAASIEYATLRHAQGHPEHEDGDRQGMTLRQAQGQPERDQHECRRLTDGEL